MNAKFIQPVLAIFFPTNADVIRHKKMKIVSKSEIVTALAEPPLLPLVRFTFFFILSVLNYRSN